MNQQALSQALRELASKLPEASVAHPDLIRSDVLDITECLLVLARIVDGKPLDKAFGAPGDWGYDTPIGDALAGRGGAK